MANDPHRNPVSPKVTRASIGSALAVVILYALAQVPAIGELPAAVAGAVTVLVVAGVTWVAGYMKADPHRDS